MPASFVALGVPMKIKGALLGLIAAVMTVSSSLPVYADVTDKDIQVLGRAIGFIENGPSGTVSVAVVYADGDAASQAAADALAGQIGSGKSAGKLTLNASSVAASALGSAGAQIILVPNGQAGVYSAVQSAATSGQGISVSADKACAEAGACIIAVATAPKVEIFISGSASAAAGVNFGSAFRMMIKEL